MYSRTSGSEGTGRSSVCARTNAASAANAVSKATLSAVELAASRLFGMPAA
jgi:hypothetical protein